jgi:hypothetical protein
VTPWPADGQAGGDAAAVTRPNCASARLPGSSDRAGLGPRDAVGLHPLRNRAAAAAIRSSRFSAHLCRPRPLRSSGRVR